MAGEPLLTPAMIRGREIHIVGLGSLGGAIFQDLFRSLGAPAFASSAHYVAGIHLWDNDRVEEHNRYNQRVDFVDVGNSKGFVHEASARGIYPECSIPVVPHIERIVTGTPLSGIVISAVHSMRERCVVLSCVKDNPAVSFFADGRVGMDGGKAFGLDPNNPEHLYRYENPPHMHDDPPEAVAACKTEFPIPSTAGIVAGKVVWRLTRWLHLEQGCMDPYANFVGFSFIPYEQEVVEYWDEPGEDETSGNDGC